MFVGRNMWPKRRGGLIFLLAYSPNQANDVYWGGFFVFCKTCYRFILLPIRLLFTNSHYVKGGIYFRQENWFQQPFHCSWFRFGRAEKKRKSNLAHKSPNTSTFHLHIFSLTCFPLLLIQAFSARQVAAFHFFCSFCTLAFYIFQVYFFASLGPMSIQQKFAEKWFKALRAVLLNSQILHTFWFLWKLPHHQYLVWFLNSSQNSDEKLRHSTTL